MSQETIVALATPFGLSAIAKIRVSGSGCRELVQQALSRGKLISHQAFLANYTDISGQILDQVIALFFEDCKAYTGEDSVEIDCHGNPLIIHKIVNDIIARGSRLAEPGEFTRRAFLNKKLDLCQAEAVLDVIHATNENALKISQRQLQGALSEKIFNLSDVLLTILAELEAHIDFSDEELDLDLHIERLLTEVLGDIDKIIENHRFRNCLQKGISVAIIGRPNVGKSSLLNALLQEERALVSEVPGTTRDFISETVLLGSTQVKIIDTAGLRKTEDVVESLGIQKTISNIREADICCLVIDAKDPQQLEPEVLKELAKKVCLTVYNKIDLLDSLEIDRINSVNSVMICAKDAKGIEALKTAILGLIEKNQMLPKEDELIVNERHCEIFKKVRECIISAQEILTRKQSYELCASDVRLSLETLGYITGAYNTEEMLGKIFSKFCVGK